MADQQERPDLTDEQLKNIASDPRLTNEDLQLLKPSELQRMQAIGGRGMLPFARPNPNTTPANDSARAFFGELAKAGELGVGLIPGLGLPARLGLDAGMGALTGALNDEDPLKRAGYNAGIDVVGNAVGKYAPLVGLIGAQAFGGKFRNLVKDAGSFLEERAAASAAREGSPLRNFGGLPIGAPSRTGDRIKAVGQALQEAEEANPAKIPLDVLKGSNQNLIDRSINSSTPVSDMKYLKKEENRFIREQAARRGGIQINVVPGQSQNQTAAMQLPTGNMAANGAKVPPPNPMQDATFEVKYPELSVRDAGELKRAQAAASKKVIEAKKNGQYVGPHVDLQSQIEAERASKLGGILDAVAPETEPLNRRLSNLFNMQGVNNQLGGQGRTLTRLGTMGARGAVGTAVIGSLGALGGMDPITALRTGAILGLFASPANASRLGYGVGRVGEVLPHALRAADLGTDILNKLGENSDADLTNFTEKPDHPNVQRRKPK